jgi:hypothetical protein
MKTRYQALLMLSLTSLIMIVYAVNAPAQKRNKGKQAIKEMELWDLDTMIAPVPIGRRLFTDKIEKTLDEADARDSLKDAVVNYRDNETTQLFTRAFMADAPRIVILTENLIIDHNEKVKYHRILQDKLRAMLALPWDTLAADYFTNDLNNLRGLIVAQYRHNVLQYVQQNTSLLTLRNIQLMEDHAVEVTERMDAKAYLYRNLAKEYPLEVLEKLPEMKDQPYSDSVVAEIANILPGTILSYARSGNALSKVIKRNANPFVQTLARMADESKEPKKLLPFLGPIYRGEKTIAEVNGYVTNDNKYYQALVDLIISKEQVCKANIEEEIKSRSQAYALKINNESKDITARFAPVQSMRDIDYYVMIVQGKDVLYASSFVNGLYPLMVKAMNNRSGKEVFAQMGNYHFRTFIRLCAAYNTLADFTKTMSPSEKNTLFKEFGDRLETGDINDLSEAIEVANTFPYLNDEDTQDQLRSDFYVHYDRVKAAKNENTAKGLLTYGILQILFNPDDNSNKSIEERLGINPVSQIPYDQFLSTNNEIVEQIFFYADKSGKSSYNAFVNDIKSNSAWKITDNAKWLKITSNSDKKITVYANKATSDSAGVTAISALRSYLQQNKINPVIAFHSGPLANLVNTINELNPDARVLMADNTFGDDNLRKALEKNVDIHLLACRQTAIPAVSLKVFAEMNKQLSYGRNLNWSDMWKDLNSYYNDADALGKEAFSQYTQPDKNAAVLFVKAYLETKRKRLDR